MPRECKTIEVHRVPVPDSESMRWLEAQMLRAHNLKTDTYGYECHIKFRIDGSPNVMVFFFERPETDDEYRDRLTKEIEELTYFERMELPMHSSTEWCRNRIAANRTELAKLGVQPGE